jgi:urea transport system permease protein
MLSVLLDALFSGISIGSVLLLSALGLAIVFGLMGVINMAHGEMMMLGAYTTVVVQNLCKGTPLADLYIFPALIAAFVVTALVGLLLERGVIRFLYGRPLETLLATWGVSLILQQFVRSVSNQFVVGVVMVSGLIALGWWWLGLIESLHSRLKNLAISVWVPLVMLITWKVVDGVAVGMGSIEKLAFTKPWFGAQNQELTAPTWLREGIKVADTQFSSARIFIIVVTVLALLAVYFFLNRTRWGLRIRAVMQNRDMSACLGIPTNKIDALTFALGSGLAGIAGCAVGLIGSVGPDTGQNYIVDTFMVVVVGGVGKLTGSIVAAIAIGVMNYLIGSNLLVTAFAGIPPIAKFFEFFATISMAKVLVFALIIVFLQYKPAGLFPQKGRAVDA